MSNDYLVLIQTKNRNETKEKSVRSDVTRIPVNLKKMYLAKKVFKCLFTLTVYGKMKVEKQRKRKERRRETYPIKSISHYLDKSSQHDWIHCDA